MKLYKHQIEGLAAVADLHRVAFFWDMGSGKTFVGSEKMMELGEQVNLVVCQKSKIQDWVDHFRMNYPDIDVMDMTESKAVENWFNKNGIMLGDEMKVLVINYDLIWRRPELLKLHNFTLMLDESSLIQNENAKRSKFILKMEPANVILLSGTPTGGKYETLWSQMHLLGWNISKELYWKQFVEVEYLDDIADRSIPIVVGYKNVDRLKRKMKQHGCQFLKIDEIFDMPEQIFTKLKIETSSWYRKFKKDRYVAFQWEGEIQNTCDPYDNGDVELVGDTTLTKMLYERMLCGQYSEEKLNAFSDLLESTEDRLIVFYNFTAELEAMQEICEKPVSIVNGKVKDLSAYENSHDSVTFVQYQAGAMGLNLQKACRMVFFTLPLSSELYEQAKKRIHRIGQDRPCFYYQLICKNSIEEKILETLEMRKDFTEELFRKEDAN